VNCRETDDLLQEFIDGGLPPAQREAMAEHHRTCGHCAAKYHDTLAVIGMLKRVEVPPASPDFAARAIARATRKRQPARARTTRWMPAGIAASLLAAALVVLLVNPRTADPDHAVVRLGDAVQVIRVAIDSAHAIDGVSMRIDVSDNLRISGYENRTAISWTASLNKGTNVISLPVSAISGGDGEITARVRLKDRVRTFRIKTRRDAGPGDELGRGRLTGSIG
jgi:hypothetical protein